MPPFAYATARLQIITAEMCLLDLLAKRHEATFAAAEGVVAEDFNEAWDRTIADWWKLAEEAEALSADLDPACAAIAGVAAAMARMLRVAMPGSC